MLPHLRPENKKEEEPYVDMEREIAKRHSHSHPNYDEADFYGNPAMTGDKTDSE